MTGQQVDLDAIELRAMRFHKLNPLHECFDSTTVLALVAELRQERERADRAEWAAGIVGDVARESSGGWQDASAELHAVEARLREAEACIERARGWAVKPITGFTAENQMAEVADALAAYKPTKTENGSER